MWSDFFLQAYTYLEPGGVVMIPLILTSVWMWTLIIERLIWFARLSKLDISLGQALQSAHSGRLPEGASGLRTDVVRFFLNERTGRRDVDILLLDRLALHVRPYIRRSLSTIAILAAVAPLFGLLGTVTGMITTFDVITLFGTGNAKAMAGGISEALITTQSGLLAATPGLFMSVFLSRRAAKLEDLMQETISILKRRL